MSARLRCALVLLLIATAPAAAGLTQTDLAGVTAAPPPGAAVPLERAFADANGRLRSLRVRLGGRPALLILADFRCTQLCGPVLAIAGAALAASGLAPGREAGLIVLGFDPDATAADAAAMADGQIARPDIRAATQLVIGPPAAVAALETSLGVSVRRDAEAGRYAHPVAAFVLAPDGRVAAVLDSLALDGPTLRRALVAAGEGRIGSFGERLGLLCYGLDPAVGIHALAIGRILAAGGGLTLAGLAALIGLLLHRGTGARRPEPRP